MFCFRCGNEFDDGANFCPKCGLISSTGKIAIAKAKKVDTIVPVEIAFSDFME